MDVGERERGELIKESNIFWASNSTRSSNPRCGRGRGNREETGRKLGPHIQYVLPPLHVYFLSLYFVPLAFSFALIGGEERMLNASYACHPLS